jgi:hypothetical protein
MRRVAVGAFAACCLAGCAGLHQPKPSWISTGVTTLRSYFVGSPSPDSVAWGSTADSDWVTIKFSTTQTCKRCHGPTGSVVTGRRATITWQHGRRKSIGISIQKH